MSIKKNSLYNLAGSIISVLVSLVAIPIYINTVGEERYGIISIIWLLIGYFGIFDFGLTQAVSQHMAKISDATSGMRAKTFWTALSISSVLGIFGGGILWVVGNLFFERYIQTNIAIKQEIMSSLPLIIAAVPIATISGVLSGALQGRERFMELNLINTAGITLFQILPLYFSWLFGATLQLLIASALFARIITMFFLATGVKYYIPLIGLPRIDASLMAPLFRFGGWITISGVISPVMTTFDRLLIGIIVGARGVTQYTVPFNLVSRILILPMSITSAAYPRLASSSEWGRKVLSGEILRVLLAVTTPLVIIGMLFMKPFIGWWINTQFAVETALIGQVILLGVWANSSARIAFVELQAGGRPDLVAKTHLVEILPYVALIFFGLTQFGIAGAAIAWSIRASVDAAILLWLTGARAKEFQIFILPVFALLFSLICSIFEEQNLYVFRGIMGGLLLITLRWAFLIMPNGIQVVVKNYIFRN